MDRGVVETLAAIGPAAAEALPALEALLPPEDGRKDDDPLAVAISRIRGA